MKRTNTLFFILLFWIGAGHLYASEFPQLDIQRLKETPEYRQVVKALDEGKPQDAREVGRHAQGALYLLIGSELQQFYLRKKQYSACTKLFIPRKRESSRLEKYLLGKTYFHKGEAYDYLEQPDSSLYFHQKSLNLRREVLGNHHLETATSYGYLGFLYRYRMSDLVQAEYHYRQQLKALEHIEAEAEHRARCFYNLSSTLGERRDHRLALTYAHQALELAQSDSMSVIFQAYCLTAVGNNHKLLEQYTKAIHHYRQAIVLLEKEWGNGHPALILRLNNLGIAYWEALQDSAALYCFDRALNIALKTYHGEALPVADCYMLVGLHQSQADSRMPFIRKALGIYRQNCEGFCKEVAEAYVQMGRWWERKGALDSADYYYRQAFMEDEGLPDVQQTLTQPYRITILENYAYLCLQRKRFKEALRVSLLLDEALTLNRISFQREGSKLHQAGQYQNIYENGLRAALPLRGKLGGVDSLAWRLMEKSKAQVLLESVASLQIRSGMGLPEALVEKESALRAEFARLEALLPAADEGTVAAIRQQQYRLTREQDSLLEYTRSHFPNYYRLKYNTDVPALTSVQAYLQESEQELLEFFWGEEGVYAFRVSATHCILQRIGSTDSLKTLLRRYRNFLQKGFVYESREKDFEEITRLSYHLYRKLLSPVLKGSIPEKLIIVPDGPLALLPFETLLTRLPPSNKVNYQELDYLVQSMAIQYAYSAGFLMEAPGRRPERSRYLLAFGHSISGPRALPRSVDEVQLLKERFPGTRAYWEEASRKSRFMKEQGQAGILHLALHNLNDTLEPYNSGLIFPGTGAEPLRLHELYGLQFEASLAVLSACESGTGRLYKGEGVFSMGRAFAYAGIPAVVTSLWPVSDAKVPAFMSTFYEALFNGQTSTAALTTAKRNYLQHSDKFNAHPAYWGAFIAIGDTLPAEHEGYPLWILRGLLLLSAVGLVWAVFSKRKRGYTSGKPE